MLPEADHVEPSTIRIGHNGIENQRNNDVPGIHSQLLQPASD